MVAVDRTFASFMLPLVLLLSTLLSAQSFTPSSHKLLLSLARTSLTQMRQANTDDTHYHYSPFLPDDDDTNTALVILNSPIRNPPSPLFQRLWNMSSFRVCADGGANRLFDATTKGSADDHKYVPNLIRGDLDSLRPLVKEHYASLGVKVERDADQDSNDLDKCLQVIEKEWLESNCRDHRVIIYGAFGGRFDQEMASIQALFKWKTILKNRMFLYDDNTTAILLSEGVVNEIRLPFYGDKVLSVADIGDGPTCGLIPIGSKCEVVKTTGLKWNLQGDCPLEFGGLVSSSNHVVDRVATVECSHPLVFTAEVASGEPS